MQPESHPIQTPSKTKKERQTERQTFDFYKRLLGRKGDNNITEDGPHGGPGTEHRAWACSLQALASQSKTKICSTASTH